jgi:flagellar biosynthetic protein FliP
VTPQRVKALRAGHVLLALLVVLGAGPANAQTVAAEASAGASVPAGDRARPSDLPASAIAAPGAPSSSSSARNSPPRRRASPANADGSPSAGLGIDLRLPADPAGADTSPAVRIVLGLTLLAILPALLVCVTAFLRIIIVLSMLRHAIGMPETPPNTVLIGLAIFLTLFTMSPMLQALNQDALQPFLQGRVGTEGAYAKASKPLREFMARQTREQDIALMVDLSKAPRPQSMDDVSNVQLIPAFMLSELRAAFQIGFVVFLPFLLIDLIVSSVLMALGMMMMPPVTVALPLKLLMFILVDGWSLILKALVGSFH